MAIQRTRFIPEGAIKVTAKDSETVAYLYTTPKGNPAAIVYAGKAAKPYAWHSYRTADRREQHLRDVFQRRAAIAKVKADRAAAKRAWINPYKVGDLFRRSWGYDQTNINWYEVIAVKGKMLEVREIQQTRVEDGWLHGKTTPLPGAYSGEAFRCLAQDGRIKINHYAHAYFVAPTLVAGVKTYGVDRYSSYA